MISYEDVFSKCVDIDQLREVYNDFLDSCYDLSEIRHIDNAYLKEFNRRRANERSDSESR